MEQIKLFNHKLIRFALVGTGGLIIDFSITWIFKEIFFLQPLYANAIGFCIAVVSNYSFNKIWTFQSETKNILNQFFKFLAISMIGLFLNTSILWSLQYLNNMRFYFNKGLATALVVLWNYFANSRITFKK